MWCIDIPPPGLGIMKEAHGEIWEREVEGKKKAKDLSAIRGGPLLAGGGPSGSQTRLLRLILLICQKPEPLISASFASLS
jgi:hypothetical protein